MVRLLEGDDLLPSSGRSRELDSSVISVASREPEGYTFWVIARRDPAEHSNKVRQRTMKGISSIGVDKLCGLPLDGLYYLWVLMPNVQNCGAAQEVDITPAFPILDFCPASGFDNHREEGNPHRR
jgi:hypothetical protein